MKRFGTFRGEEIVARFSDNFVLDDYGVPGSPRFWVPEGNTEIEDLSILGKDLDLGSVETQLRQLLKAIPGFAETPIGIFLDHLTTAIYELADEVEFDEEDDVDEPWIE